MANFAVTFNPGTTGGRLTTGGDSITGWSGGGAEPDFFYQGANSYSVLVKTTEAGIAYNHASTLDFTTARLVVLFKVIQTNKDALDGDGVQLWIGNDASNAYSYFVFTSTTYPAEGGWQVVAIDPQVSQWRSATEGAAPSMTAIDYFAFRSDCSATAKSQNFAGDAVDVIENGKGLIGDGSDTTGTYAAFSTFDYGTVGNRYGIVQARGGILYVTGVIKIGSSAQTAFTDANAVLVFPHHRVTTGFCGVDWDITHASTVISATNCVYSGRGALYTSDDTRPDYEAIGTGGTLTISGSTFNVYRLITLNSKVTALSCNFIGGGAAVVVAGANIAGSSFSDFTGEADTSSAIWNVASDPNGELDDTEWAKGTNAHHALELGSNTPSEITLTGWTVSGFNATNGQNDSVIYNNSGKAITINVTGNTGTISYKNGASASTTILTDQRTLTIEIRDDAGTLITDATEVTLVKTADTSIVYQAENVTTGSTSYVYAYSSDVVCYLNVVSTGAYVPKTVEPVTLVNANQTVVVQLAIDRVFSNPD